MIIRHPRELSPEPRRVSLAIGVFDGVHLGHQQVIRQSIADARQHDGRAIVITFDRHPAEIIAPHRAPPLIYSLPQKLRVINSLGVDAILLLHFDLSFSRIQPDDFIRNLARDFSHIHSICVGSRFSFGHKRAGDVSLLQKLGADLQFIVHGLASVSLDGEIVSSTRIRGAIKEGRLHLAGQMLGRPYSLSSTVIPGDQLGRKLGFPTANLDISNLVLPPNGVYAAHALTGGNLHRAVLNIGFRPTRQDPKPQLHLELHLLDFHGDLYGRELEVVFIQKIRPEQSFPSLDALQKQISRDIAAARSIFA